MRELTTAAANWITQPVGVEPVNILIISWVDGQWNYYADTNYGELTQAGVSPELGIDGLILEMSNFESLPDIDGKGSSQTISVTLDDSNGSLKTILDTHDIHKRPVKVAQWFKGIALADAFVLFEGQISSPIVWSEGDRKLKFDIVSILESREIGYSIEEGDFDYAPPNLIGRAWPYIMGTALKVPAIQIQEVPRGVTSRSFRDSNRRSNNSSASNSNIRAMNEALLRADESFAHAREIRIGIGNFGSILSTGQAIGTLSHTYYINVTEYLSEDLTRVSEKSFTISGTKADYERSIADYIKRGNDYLLQAQAAGAAAAISSSETSDSTIGIANGELFPQNTNLQLTINGRTFNGTMSGRTFNIASLASESFVGVTPASRVSVVDDYISTQYVQQIESSLPFLINGGSQISLGTNSGYAVDYIAGLDHCTVLGVYAKRSFEGQSLLWPVPEEYYSVVYDNYGPNFGTGNQYDDVKVTKISMPTPLSSRADINGESEGWSDDIFVDLVSPYGNNPVVHMKIIIQRYTTVGWDTDSFDFVEGIQNNYPIGCAITSRRDVLQVMQEMAFQMRCNIRYNNGKFYLKYLPIDYPYVGTITSDDIERSSLEVTCIPTEDLVTKFTARWSEDYSGETNRTAIYRHNINKYGTHAQDYDFWMYNIEANVHKSAVFWMIRKSNTYKRIKFNTFLTKLPLEANDYVQVTLPDTHDGTVIGMVESCVYDSAAATVTMEIWLPVRMGERELYVYAMPADLSQYTKFPTLNAIQLGQAGTGSKAKGKLLTKTADYYNSSGARGPNLEYGGNFDAFGNLLPPQNNYGVSDSGNQPQAYPTRLNPGDISRTIATGSTSENVKVFHIKPVPPPVVNRDTSNNVFPGYVIAQSDNRVYDVSVYTEGLDNDPVIIQCQQIGIADDNVLDPDTPVIVFRMRINQNGRTVERYYMQAPVWAGPVES